MRVHRLTPIIHDLNQLFESACEPGYSGQTPDFYSRPTSSSLAVELRESPEHYTLRVALPGVNPDDVNIEASNKELTLDVKAPEYTRGEHETVLHQELAQGEFRRSVKFAQPILHEQIVTNYQHGMLTLTLPKESAHKTKVKIQLPPQS